MTPADPVAVAHDLVARARRDGVGTLVVAPHRAARHTGRTSRGRGELSGAAGDEAGGDDQAAGRLGAVAVEP